MFAVKFGAFVRDFSVFQMSSFSSIVSILVHATCSGVVFVPVIPPALGVFSSSILSFLCVSVCLPVSVLFCMSLLISLRSVVSKHVAGGL